MHKGWIIFFCFAFGLLPFVTTSSPLDPAEQLQRARDTYSIDSYICTFTKSEIVNGRQMPTESSEAWVLEDPFSVYMMPHKPVQAKRILYIENRFVKDGKEYMIIEPCGLLRILISSLWVSLDDPAILKRSRNTICSFGFKRILAKIIESVSEHGQVVFLGQGEIDGRPTQIFEHDDGKLVLVLHMDTEWNLPVASYIYDGDILIGSYEFSNVRLNPGLLEYDFDPESRNLK